MLIIGAWNYPFQLVLLPMIGAIAAGNSLVVKPSEVSASVAEWMLKSLVPELDPSLIVFVTGGVSETTTLLKQKWDYIFYTGNGVVGKEVMKAAALNLTPVTLELGGKCPAIFDDMATDTENLIDSEAKVPSSLRVALKRLLMAKFLNMGQTCVAPDYVVIPQSIEALFVKEAKKVLLEFYGEHPKQSGDLSRIINKRQFSRLKLLLDTVNPSDIVIGGSSDENDLWIEPTIVKVPLQSNPEVGSAPSAPPSRFGWNWPAFSQKEEPKSSSSINSLPPILSHEIFGPILPYVTYEAPSEVANMVKTISREPLALYLYTKKGWRKETPFIKGIMRQVRAGAYSINESVSHASFRDLPFGGTGSSGFGQYYGFETFRLFSHNAPFLSRSLMPDAPIRFPPNISLHLSLISKLQAYALPSWMNPLVSRSVSALERIVPLAKL